MSSQDQMIYQMIGLQGIWKPGRCSGSVLLHFLVVFSTLTDYIPGNPLQPSQLQGVAVSVLTSCPGWLSWRLAKELQGQGQGQGKGQSQGQAQGQSQGES